MAVSPVASVLCTPVFETSTNVLSPLAINIFPDPSTATLVGAVMPVPTFASVVPTTGVAVPAGSKYIALLPLSAI